MPLDMQKVFEAIKCDHWQQFRRSLKGFKTATKLNELARYVDDEATPEFCVCSDEDRRLQVINYLNALARGGQIKAIPAEKREVKTVTTTLRDWPREIVIRRDR